MPLITDDTGFPLFNLFNTVIINFPYMNFDFEPGDYVINPKNKNWGIGQIQSIINNKITVNFENKGKQVINSFEITLEKVKNIEKT